jgi:hypothetical protein
MTEDQDPVNSIPLNADRRGDRRQRDDVSSPRLIAAAAPLNSQHGGQARPRDRGPRQTIVIPTVPSSSLCVESHLCSLPSCCDAGLGYVGIRVVRRTRRVAVCYLPVVQSRGAMVRTELYVVGDGARVLINWKRIREWIHDAGSLSGDLKNIAWAVGLLGVVVWTSVVALRGHGAVATILAIVLASVLSFFLAVTVSGRRTRRLVAVAEAGAAADQGTPISPPNSPMGYIWKDARFTLALDPDNPHRARQVARITVEALRNDVHVIENKYRWTGEGDEAIPKALRSGQSVMGPNPIHREDDCRTYYIFLEKALDKGDQAVVEIEQLLEDKRARMQPRLSKTVTQAVDHLTLQVRLPPQLIPQGGLAAKGIERQSTADGTEVLRRVDLTFDADGQVEWQPQQVVRGRRYEIDWDWFGYRLAQPHADVPAPTASPSPTGKSPEVIAPDTTVDNTTSGREGQ